MPVNPLLEAVNKDSLNSLLFQHPAMRKTLIFLPLKIVQDMSSISNIIHG